MSETALIKGNVAKLTYAHDQHIRFVRLNWNKVVLNNRELMPIDPEFQRHQTSRIHEADLVLRALLELQLMVFSLARTPRVITRIAVKDALAVDKCTQRNGSMRREDFEPIERKRVRVVPVANEQRAEIYVVVHAGGAVDYDRTEDAVGV